MAVAGMLHTAAEGESFGFSADVRVKGSVVGVEPKITRNLTKLTTVLAGSGTKLATLFTTRRQ